MQVKFIRERSLPAVSSTGPFTRIFAIGEIHDLSEIHAQTFIAQGDAVLVKDKPAKVEALDTDETVEVKPARKRSK